MKRGLLPYLLGAAAIALVPMVVLGLTDVRVPVVPWMLAALLAGVIWWAFAGDGPSRRSANWQAPRPDPQPMRFTADLRTRRVVTMVVDAQPSKGFTGVALTNTLAARARSRLVRNHGLPDDDPLAHAGHLLSPQLLDYLRRAGTDDTQTVSPRTLRIYLKEIEAL
ncbi:MAG: hypothetical protein GX596_11640 [Propionibacterium sp.]|nr:hypothetical protein [Propionibacterium sp.]